VHAAICAQPKPVHGCAVEPLGAMAYAAVCSPAFAQREGWAVHEGEAGLRVRVGGAALAQASCLVFNRKDGLQAAFLAQSASGKRQQIQRTHHLPSASGFVLGALHGLGWGMCPERMCESHLASGELLRIELPDPVGAAATPDGLRVPLYWQHVRWQTQLMLRLTRHIRETASLNLNP
jgi:LysR family transcriptional regulator, chromosome initiation inhibitor